jgi:hypothetical protein
MKAEERKRRQGTPFREYKETGLVDWSALPRSTLYAESNRVYTRERVCRGGRQPECRVNFLACIDSAFCGLLWLVNRCRIDFWLGLGSIETYRKGNVWPSAAAVTSF